MFAKLKESKLFKSLSGAFCANRKGSAKESAVAGLEETTRTGETKGGDKPKSEKIIA